MLQLRFSLVAVLCSLSCLSSDGVSADASRSKPKPLVAAVWAKLGASGAQEVVIEVDADKLKSQGLTLDQLRRATKGRRFVAGDWTVVIDERQYDLAALGKLTVRELAAPPFTVQLRDGREVLITPNPKRIGHYVVTGEFFEQSVRDGLADFSGEDPGTMNILGMILVPGTVIPHFTEKDTMRHFSVGEPLKTFAKVEVAAQRKPSSKAASPPGR